MEASIKMKLLSMHTCITTEWGMMNYKPNTTWQQTESLKLVRSQRENTIKLSKINWIDVYLATITKINIFLTSRAHFIVCVLFPLVTKWKITKIKHQNLSDILTFVYCTIATMYIPHNIVLICNVTWHTSIVCICTKFHLTVLVVVCWCSLILRVKSMLLNATWPECATTL